MNTKLVRADCLNMLSYGLDRESVDVVVTSPPYNISKKDAGGFEVHMDDDEYMVWLISRLVIAMTALKPEGSLFLNVAGKPSKQQLPFRIVTAMMNRGFYLQNWITWVKSVSLKIDGETKSVGHFKPINSKRFLNDCHEPVFHFTKTGNVEIDRLAIGVPYEHKSNVGRWKQTDESGDLRCRGNVWHIPHETRTRKGDHPTAFPVDLPKMAMLMHGRAKCKTVMDPFMGSGTTGAAAYMVGAEKFFGFDVTKEAIEIAKGKISGLLDEPPQIE